MDCVKDDVKWSFYATFGFIGTDAEIEQAINMFGWDPLLKYGRQPPHDEPVNEPKEVEVLESSDEDWMTAINRAEFPINLRVSIREPPCGVVIDKGYTTVAPLYTRLSNILFLYSLSLFSPKILLVYVLSCRYCEMFAESSYPLTVLGIIDLQIISLRQ